MCEDANMEDRVREAYNQLLKLLGPREHFECEARVKLLKRGYDEAVVDAALARARDRSYLDDDRALETWLRQQLRKGGHGSAWLLSRLGQKGVDGNRAAEALREHFPREAELEAAWSMASRSGSRIEAQRLAGRLARRGFSASVVAEVLRRLELDGTEGED